ncbi:coiled-coil domain-containing protein 60 isoform X1 [Amia ocellicauda]|uniref:coiled-coil domain-containing protein 60 isoform X1 n=1 Tax=Amia ocellicauda TaxID=2972642 RepID=UPI0034642A38
MPVQASKALDPRNFVLIKPLPIAPPVGEKLQARSATVFSSREPSREQVFRDNYQRRLRQLSRQGYRAASWRPYEEVGEPLYLEAEKLILTSLGQLEEQTGVEEPSGRLEDNQEYDSNTALPEASEESKNLTSNETHLKKSEDEVKHLHRHLSHTRRLVSAVKQGRGYFQMLQKEAVDLQRAQQEEQRRLAERQRTECQPPLPSSEEDSDSDGPTQSFFRTALPAEQRRLSGKHSKREKISAVRTFTPVHRSLTSPQLADTPLETIFRQLCCLNWLLEALTLEPAGRAGPVSSCWNIKDPGRSKMTIKRLNKEKAIEIKWDQFITQPKPKKSPSRALRKLSVRPWRTSLLSCSRLSVLSSAVTPTMGSMSSLPPGSDDLPAGAEPVTPRGVGHSEDGDPAASAGTAHSKADSEAQAPVSDYLEKLLEAVHQSVAKELQSSGQPGANPSDSLSPAKQIPGRNEKKQTGSATQTPRPKSSPMCQPSAVSQFIASKSSLSSEMRARFSEKAEEVALSLNDTLENKAKKRWENGVRKFLSCEHWPQIQPDLHAVRTPSVKPETAETKENQDSNTWMSGLLSSIPETILEDRSIRCVLDKLVRFADGQSLRIRPNQFLKVLSGLRLWELCSPDFCVAVEMVREHIVRMSKADYEVWLWSRVTVPPRVQSAPALR